MKKLIFTTAICMAMAVTSMAQNPKASYLLNNNGDDTIASHHLTMNNVTYTNDYEGLSKHAAHFNGTDSWAQIPSAIFSSNPLEYRLSLWFKTNNNQKGGGLAFAGKESVGNYVTNYTPILYIDTNGQLNTFIYDGGVTPIKSTATVNDNKWHHAMVVYSVNSNNGALTQALYLDGQSVASKSGTIGGTPSFTNMYIGACCARGIGAVTNNWMYFDGDIDEVNIYDGVLSGGTWSNFMFKLTSMPASQQVSIGDSATFQVNHTDFLSESFRYTWKKNGSAVSINSNPFKIASVTASDTGTYVCEILNPNGKTLVSQAAVLSLKSNTSITNIGSQQNNYNIYPNPATHIINIAGITNYSTIIIFDVTGKALLNSNVNNGQQNIDISSLSNGLYFINILKDGEVMGGSKFLKE